MTLREPAGWERGGGKSAELSPRARSEGGAAGKTRGTVREAIRGCAICLQIVHTMRCVLAVGRSVSLPTFFVLSEIKKYGGHNHEV